MSGALRLYTCAGGDIVLPAQSLVLVDRADGGNLVINPPRDVWERSELSVAELTAWSHLVAATGQAMIESLPQLEAGCVNYWEAGNWALNEAAAPVGPKTAPQHRSVHMHLLGRSRFAQSADHQWGEAPRFPLFGQRLEWANKNARLAPEECRAIVERADALLETKFDLAPRFKFTLCADCGYPLPESGHDCG